MAHLIKSSLALYLVFELKQHVEILHQKVSMDIAPRGEGIKLIKRTFKEWKIPIIFVTHSNFEAEVLADKIIKIG
jgi:ABC-type sugar transport system ATPase subunit